MPKIQQVNRIDSVGGLHGEVLAWRKLGESQDFVIGAVLVRRDDPATAERPFSTHSVSIHKETGQVDASNGRYELTERRGWLDWADRASLNGTLDIPA